MGRLPGAINIPLDEPEGRRRTGRTATNRKDDDEPEERVSRLDPRREIANYCRGPESVLSFEAMAGEAGRRRVELDQTRIGRLSRMDALQGQAMALETERRRKQDLQRLDAALKRLDEGEYGYCVSCGEAIAPKRLELDPTVPTCIRCASKQE